jgi:hypothetical protein
MRARFFLFLLALVLLSSPVGLAQPDQPGPPERLGSVNFSTSCSSAAQPQFNRGVALMHSFQFARAIESFHAILVSDPSCSMAWWGIALSSWGNPFATGLKPQAQLDQGLRALMQARDGESGDCASGRMWSPWRISSQMSPIPISVPAFRHMKAQWLRSVRLVLMTRKPPSSTHWPSPPPLTRPIKPMPGSSRPGESWRACMSSILIIRDWHTTSFTPMTFRRWLPAQPGRAAL